jgi:hypothetical protein
VDAARGESLVTGILSLDPHRFRLEGAGAEKDRIVLFLKLLEGNVAAQLGIEADLAAEAGDDLDIPPQQMARHAVIRNTDSHRSARLAEHVEDGHLIAFEEQVVGTGNPGRAGADNADLFSLPGLGHHRRLLVVHPLVIGGDPFQHHDADRFVDQCPAAGFLAGVRTDPAADRRNRHVAPDSVKRLVETVVLDLLDIGGDVDVGRTLVHTRGGQLLLVGGGVLRLALPADVSEVVFAEILDRIENRNDRRHAEGALAVLEQRRQTLDGIQVCFRAVAGYDTRQGILQDPCPLFARGAFGAAVILLHPLHVLGGHRHHVGFPVEEDHPVPAHESANLSFMVVVIGKLELERGQVSFTAATIVDDLSAPAGKCNLSQLDLLLEPRFANPKKGRNTPHKRRKVASRLRLTLTILYTVCS